MTLPIITKRLVLRRFKYEDLDDILAFHSHPSVRQATAGTLTPTQEGVRDYIKTQLSYRDFEPEVVFDLAIEQKRDRKVIGLLTLITKEHRQGEIGWALGIEHRGQGYATEGAAALLAYGFQALGLHRIQAETSRENEPSWKVMERLGMVREACLRDAIFREGQHQDKLIYGCLADDYAA